MYIAKQKETHRYRKQTSVYQWGEGRGQGKVGIQDLEIQATRYKRNKK